MPRSRSTETLALAALAAGCSALFGIDEPNRKPSESETGGKGGTSAGEGGTSAGNAGARTGGTGAGGSSDSGTGGAMTGGSGGGGIAGSGGEGALGGQGGVGGVGAGGEGDEEFPDVGDPCTTPGAFACDAPQSKGRFICRNGVWEPTEHRCNDFDPRQNCDRRTGACGAIICGDNFSQCISPSELTRCGPDFVSKVTEFCPFDCVADGVMDDRCAEPTGDQIITDYLPEITGRALWPELLVPVCWLSTDGPKAIIQAEADSTWGRYSALAFSGWEACAEPAVGVALSFVSQCDGRLAGISRYGYPGPGRTVEVEICTSYYLSADPTHEEKLSDETMLRFIARHVFGHVVGATHASDQWINANDVAMLPFEPYVVTGEVDLYGAKHSGSLVNASGRCVDSELTMRPLCDGSSAQRWELTEGQLVLEGRCLTVSESALRLNTCSSPPPIEPEWIVSPAQWRDWQARCVGINRSMGNALVVQHCQPFGDPDQTWSFEFPSPRRVRIRWVAGPSLCVRIPDGIPPSAPVLGECNDARAEFDTTPLGQLTSSGYCMIQGASFVPCVTSVRQSNFLSGVFQHSSGALTMTPDGVVVADLLLEPNPTQIFDYHF